MNTQENKSGLAVRDRNPNVIALDKNGKVDLSQYNETQLAKYRDLGTSLKAGDTNSVLNFGLDLQNKLAAYSDSFLGNIRAFDAGEIGTCITDLLSEINYVDVDPASKGPVTRMLMNIPGVKNLIMNTKKIFQKYDTITNNIDGIVQKLDKGRISIMRDNTSLQSLFEQNLEFISQLEELIVAGQIRYEDMMADITNMEANRDRYEDYEIADARDFANRLSKRLTDMIITRTITIQSLPQIRLVQNNNATMIEKIQSSITTTIPIWKNQISIAVALMRQKNILEVQKKVNETTNTILVKNSEMLKQNSIEVAKQNEQTVVSLETLKTVNQNLISTLAEIKKIKEEGEASRKNIAKEIESLENELKANVTQLGK
jgi:uncharacterized protein YaaN involved in tellurite resistance